LQQDAIARGAFMSAITINTPMFARAQLVDFDGLAITDTGSVQASGNAVEGIGADITGRDDGFMGSAQMSGVHVLLDRGSVATGVTGFFRGGWPSGPGVTLAGESRTFSNAGIVIGQTAVYLSLNGGSGKNSGALQSTVPLSHRACGLDLHGDFRMFENSGSILAHGTAVMLYWSHDGRAPVEDRPQGATTDFINSGRIVGKIGANVFGADGLRL